ncbi:MAG: HAMP domain-containing histidine kinase [Clostridiales bacterium]|nr:HAMP domain-containing histidine kinase [Clostridiales bacterium]
MDRLNVRKALRLSARFGRIGRGLLLGLRTLRWKLFLSYLLVSIIPMFVLWGNTVNIVESHHIEQRALEMRFVSNQMATFTANDDYINEIAVRGARNHHIDSAAQSHSARILVVDAMAMVLFDSFEMLYQGNTLAGAGVLQALGGVQHSAMPDSRTITEIAPIFDEENAVVGAVIVTHSITDLDIVLDSINELTLGFILLMALIVAIAVMLIAQWLIRPMRHILSATQKISEGQLEERISLKSRDEFSDLGLAINDMTDKLAKVETARQEFVSNVSHELKTPLSSIKVLSESLVHQENVDGAVYKEFLIDINSEVDRMTNIVNELLTLVRLDETELPLNISHFDFNKMLEGVIKRLRPLAGQRGVSLEFTEHRQIHIEADEMKIGLAISNLVENAIKYNNPGGHVKILLDADNKNAFVTVADNGVGISEENQANVFARFFRADKGRGRETGMGGTGLGLAITHKTILLHKGSIKVASKEEEGSTFTVRIPLHHRA